MKLYELYIAEDQEDHITEGKVLSFLAKLVMGALKGIGKFGILLGGAIARNLVGNGLANGSIKPNAAMKTFQADTKVRMRQAAERSKNPEFQHKLTERHAAIEKRYEEMTDLLTALTEYDEELATKLALQFNSSYQNFIQALENNNQTAMDLLDASMDKTHKLTAAALQQAQEAEVKAEPDGDQGVEVARSDSDEPDLHDIDRIAGQNPAFA